MDLSWKSVESITSYIPMDECKDGWLYSIAARNATLGIYRESELGFEIRREKFRDIFSFIEYHWDIGTVKFEMFAFGTVKPIEEIEEAPVFGSEKEFLDYMDRRFNELNSGRTNVQW